MKTSYYLVAAVVFAAVGGAVYAWPAKTPPVGEMVRLVPAKPIADVHDIRDLPPIVTDPNVKLASADLPKVPPPNVPMSPLPPVPSVPPQPAQKLPAVPPPMATPPAPSSPLAPPSPLPTVPPPAKLNPPTPLVPPAAPGIGSVVLLTDNGIVEGHVSEAPGRVIVRRGSIDQPFPKETVQFIGKTKDECYKHLLGKLKIDDAPGRFKLARWCMYNGLREQALAEAQAVVKIQPDHKPAADLARTMDESIRLFNADGSSKVEAAKPEGPMAPKVVEPEPDVGAEAVATFPRHVQPVLVNLCADCHARPGYTGAFKMACGTGQDMDPAITRHNLRAALAQIKKTEPAGSPVLVKALTAHGGMKQPPLSGKAAPAYRALEAWVFLAAESKAAPAPALPPPDMKPALPPPPDVKSPLPPVPPPASAPKFSEDAVPTVPMVPNPENMGDAVDEFDPSTYNRAVGSKSK